MTVLRMGQEVGTLVPTNADADRIVACVNACAGIADPSAVRDLLEAVKRMNRAIENYSAEFNPSGRPKKVCDWRQFNEDLCFARAAIAKCEGGK